MAGDFYFDKIYSRWSATATATSGGVTLSRSAVAGRRHGLTGFQASGDAAALVTVEAPAGNILYRRRYTGAFTVSESFPLGTMEGGSGDLAQVKISASTANCEANMQGYDRKAK